MHHYWNLSIISYAITDNDIHNPTPPRTFHAVPLNESMYTHNRHLYGFHLKYFKIFISSFYIHLWCVGWVSVFLCMSCSYKRRGKQDKTTATLHALFHHKTIFLEYGYLSFSMCGQNTELWTLKWSVQDYHTHCAVVQYLSWGANTSSHTKAFICSEHSLLDMQTPICTAKRYFQKH